MSFIPVNRTFVLWFLSTLLFAQIFVFKLDFLNGKSLVAVTKKMYGVDEALGNQKAILLF